jgi:hypothetical protein
LQTAVELAAIAAKVGATPSDIHLGADANESTVKKVALSEKLMTRRRTSILPATVKGLCVR